MQPPHWKRRWGYCTGELPDGFAYTAVDGSGTAWSLKTGSNSLPVGVYTLTVSDSGVSFPAGYSVTTTINPEQINVSVGQTSTATVTSTYEVNQGKLILVHRTTGDYTGEAPNGFVYPAQKADGTFYDLGVVLLSLL